MKATNLKITQLAVIGFLLAFLSAGCNGGSSSKIVAVTNPDPNPNPTVTATPIHICPVWGCNGPTIVVFAYDDSVDSDTRDTDLQQANLQSATLTHRAEMISNQFQMSVEAATQLAVLGDKVQIMTVSGQEMSDEDRDAVTQSALSIAGISSDDVNQAFQHSLVGDRSATDALVEKAAKNLGMASSDNLRNQLLPALGIELQ